MGFLVEGLVGNMTHRLVKPPPDITLGFLETILLRNICETNGFQYAKKMGPKEWIRKWVGNGFGNGSGSHFLQKPLAKCRKWVPKWVRTHFWTHLWTHFRTHFPTLGTHFLEAVLHFGTHLFWILELGQRGFTNLGGHACCPRGINDSTNCLDGT